MLKPINCFFAAKAHLNHGDLQIEGLLPAAGSHIYPHTFEGMPLIVGFSNVQKPFELKTQLVDNHSNLIYETQNVIYPRKKTKTWYGIVAYTVTVSEPTNCHINIFSNDKMILTLPFNFTDTEDHVSVSPNHQPIITTFLLGEKASDIDDITKIKMERVASESGHSFKKGITLIIGWSNMIHGFPVRLQITNSKRNPIVPPLMASVSKGGFTNFIIVQLPKLDIKAGLYNLSVEYEGIKQSIPFLAKD